jgi:superfamily II DNA or RNA helicase
MLILFQHFSSFSDLCPLADNDQSLRELVDQSKDFAPVYALFQHEKLGFLIGAYVVEKNTSGQLTLQYQRLLSDNYRQFLRNLDETDVHLVQLLNEITLQNIYRQFKNKESSVQDFINGLIKHPHKDFILAYVEKRIVQALPMLKGKNFYRMSKDGYPAWKPIHFSDEQASIAFRFKRTPKETQYTAEIKLNGQTLNLIELGACILCDNPLWMMMNNTIFGFDNPALDRKKVSPFLSKTHITIPKDKEKEYYQKFLIKLLQQFEVKTEGIEVITHTEKPTFSLLVNPAGSQLFSFNLMVQYGAFNVTVDPKSKTIADVIYTDESVKVYRIERDSQREHEIASLFERLFKTDGQLFNQMMTENKALAWLTNYYGELMLAGINVIIENGATLLTHEKPILIPNRIENEHGVFFDPVVAVGDFRMSFRELRDKVRNRDPKISLPNGNIAVIPESWFDDLTPIFESAVPTELGWRIHAYHAQLLQGAFSDSGRSINDEIEAFQQIEKQPPPVGLQTELREYQASGYDWMLFLQKFNLGGILADDMGLGKTVQTLSLLLHEKEAGIRQPSLVVVPNSLVFNWLSEIKKFTPQLRSLNYTGTKRTDLLKVIPKYDLIITTYGTVRQDADKLAQIPFHYLILDESQVIKNKDSKTTEAVMQLQGTHRLSLTGTPIENSTRDLWTQMQFLNPGLLGSAHFFEQFYALPIERDRNEARQDKLARLVKPLILRRTKEMVATELPPSDVSVLYCEMSKAQEKLYNQTKKLYKSNLFHDDFSVEEELSKNSVKIFSCLQRLRQIAIHPQMIDPMVMDSGKYDILQHQLGVVLEEGSKVLIFSQFVKLLSIIKYDLMKRKINFAYLDGSTKNRSSEVDKFQNNDECKVFLISLKAGGVGLNLTAAQYVFILDPWWNPAIEQQAIARAHRIGQQKHVFGYKFITKNSIEEKILQLQERKQRIAGDVIKSESAFFKSLSKDDLISLFD